MVPINPPQSSNQVGQYDPVSKLLVGSDGMTLKPKRVPSAFLQYCSKERPRIRAKLEMEARAAGDTVPITANKVQQAAAQLWKLLPEEVQRPYYDDYNAQMITWRAQMAHVEDDELRELLQKSKSLRKLQEKAALHPQPLKTTLRHKAQRPPQPLLTTCLHQCRRIGRWHFSSSTRK